MNCLSREQTKKILEEAVLNKNNTFPGQYFHGACTCIIGRLFKEIGLDSYEKLYESFPNENYRAEEYKSTSIEDILTDNESYEIFGIGLCELKALQLANDAENLNLLKKEVEKI